MVLLCEAPSCKYFVLGTITLKTKSIQLRPYTPEHTGTRLISEVKLAMAQSVLWWGTTREYWVL
jgi:hypothetical protein